MNTVNNTTKRGFQKAYNMLPAGEQDRVREKIKETCDWQHSTFYAKLNGNTPIKKLEKAALEAIFKAWDIDVWKGEYLTKAV